MDVSEICLALVKLPKKTSSKKRVVIITCGSKPSHVAQYDHLEKKVTFKGSFDPTKIKKEEIADTNGAGDAFAGGFLSEYVQSDSRIERCMSAGHFAASKILRVRGCTLPY